MFAFMTGHVSPSKWSIEAQGENPDFKAVSGDLRKWAREKMNEVTQPKVVPKCGLDVPGKMTLILLLLKEMRLFIEIFVLVTLFCRIFSI